MPPRKRAAAPVAAEQNAAAEATPERSAAPVMSAGVASDLDMFGSTVDPATGGTWVRNPETGKTTHTSRTGEVTEL